MNMKQRASLFFPRNRILILAVLLLAGWGCGRPKSVSEEPATTDAVITGEVIRTPLMFHPVKRDIPIRDYFEYMDSLTAALDSLLHYPVNEYLIARANPRLIDSLADTDYYIRMERGVFTYDPQALIALHKGDSLLIPDSGMVAGYLDRMAATVIDVNIPEYTLRIMEGDSALYAFPVRVGRNEKKYLAMAGRKVDLRTVPGSGTIYRINRNPVFINPSDNKPYKVTRRDDGKVTKLPRIPWLDPELNGHRYGQLIHPTTNPKTLGKAYSNGCVGLSEADAWRVYFYAPVGTKVVFRYDLKTVNEQGDTVQLKDIYPDMKKLPAPVVAGLFDSGSPNPDLCLCLP